jgi:GT2 family glycosyltransferase
MALLDALREALAAGLRVLFVDNHSGDGTPETIEAAIAADPVFRDHARLVRNAENTGFTGGVNLGVAEALAAEVRPEFIWLLNPDAVAKADALAELLAVAAESGAEIITGGREYPHADAWPKPFYGLPNRHWSTTPHGRWWPIGCYGGACTLFRTKLVEQLLAADGFFQDPGLFMYWDEWDTTLRARRFGARVVFARDAKWEHPAGPRTLGPSRSACFRQYYQARNGIVVSRRNMPSRQFWLTLPLRLARDFSWFARVGLRGPKPHPGCYLLGTVDGFRGRMGRWSQHPG